MKVDVARVAPADAPDRAGRARAATSGAPAAARPATRGWTSASTRARRWRPRAATSSSRAGASAARGLRRGGLPHGHRQPRVRDPRLRRRPAQLRRAVLRRQPHRARRRLAAAVGPRRRLLHLPLEGVRRAGNHARAIARTPARSGALADLYTAKNSAEEVAAPRGGHGGVRRARTSSRRPTATARSGRSRRRPGRSACAATAAWASWRSAWSASRACIAGCGRRPTRSRPTRRWLTRRAGGGRSSAHRDRHGARRASTRRCWPAATRRRPSGYSLHTTGWAFDVSRAYASRAQARAFQFALDRLQSLEPDRLGARAGGDPRDRRAGGGAAYEAAAGALGASRAGVSSSHSAEEAAQRVRRGAPCRRRRTGSAGTW